MLRRSPSTTTGPRRTLAWIAMTYSPIIPMNITCTPEKKNGAMMIVCVPTGAMLCRISESSQSDFRSNGIIRTGFMV